MIRLKGGDPLVLLFNKPELEELYVKSSILSIRCDNDSSAMCMNLAQIDLLLFALLV